MLLVIYRRVTTAISRFPGDHSADRVPRSRRVLATPASSGCRRTQRTSDVTGHRRGHNTSFSFSAVPTSAPHWQPREAAFATMYSGTAHAAWVRADHRRAPSACTSPGFPTFRPWRFPRGRRRCRAGSRATLGPAVPSIGRDFGLVEPARPMRSRGWRRIGTAIVRRPGPVLVVTTAIALIGLLAPPGIRDGYQTRP